MMTMIASMVMMTTIMAMMKSMCIGGERLTFQSEFKLFPLISTHTALTVPLHSALGKELGKALYTVKCKMHCALSTLHYELCTMHCEKHCAL